MYFYSYHVCVHDAYVSVCVCVCEFQSFCDSSVKCADLKRGCLEIEWKRCHINDLKWVIGCDVPPEPPAKLSLRHSANVFMKRGGLESTQNSNTHTHYKWQTNVYAKDTLARPKPNASALALQRRNVNTHAIQHHRGQILMTATRENVRQQVKH